MTTQEMELQIYCAAITGILASGNAPTAESTVWMARQIVRMSWKDRMRSEGPELR